MDDDKKLFLAIKAAEVLEENTIKATCKTLVSTVDRLCEGEVMKILREGLDEVILFSREEVIAAFKARQKMKPNNRLDFTDDLDVGVCPSCGDGCNSDMKFCSECGQALDWAADEEVQS